MLFSLFIIVKNTIYHRSENLVYIKTNLVANTVVLKLTIGFFDIYQNTK